MSGTRPSPAKPRVLVADRDAAVHEWARPALHPLGAEILRAESCAEIEAALATYAPLDLVITASQLPDGSALQVLARARSRGVDTPFIIHTSFHRNLLRVFVSDNHGTVLSSRVVDGENLAALARRVVAEVRMRRG